MLPTQDISHNLCNQICEYLVNTTIQFFKLSFKILLFLLHFFNYSFHKYFTISILGQKNGTCLSPNGAKLLSRWKVFRGIPVVASS